MPNQLDTSLEELARIAEDSSSFLVIDSPGDRGPRRAAKYCTAGEVSEVCDMSTHRILTSIS